jgi:hypothetical protein
MYRWLTARSRLGVLVASALMCLTVAACGSSGADPSGSAQTLLRQTFAGGQSVHSGILDFALSAQPAGSSTLTTPVAFSLSGPFQSRGAGQIPESNFTFSISGLGRHGQLGVISTGTAGYVTLDGAAYPLPAADFQKLESSFSSASSSSGGHGGLAGLGINPEHWLSHPSIVGTTTLNGASTTHIHSGVNVSALLSDLNTFLAKKGSAAGAKVGSIPAATQQRIASEVHNATVDVWTGASDHLLRRLVLDLTIPVTGQISTLLGGLRSAALALTIQYSDLNQPETITAPSQTQPYSAFQAKLRSLFSTVSGGLNGITGGGAASGTAGSGSSSSSGSTAGANAYSQCISQANGDVLKMQKCAPLLNTGG